MTIRIVLADDADLLLIGAKAVLSSNSRFDVVGTARSESELLMLVETTKPDVVIVAERLAQTDALTLLYALKAQACAVRVIVLGSNMDGLHIYDLLYSGANGYLFRADDLEFHLGWAVDMVLRERQYLSPTANAEYLILLNSPMRASRIDEEGSEVLRLLGKGVHIDQIAHYLGVPRRRIYSIRDKLRKHFGAMTNEHLISRAVEEGFHILDT